MFLSFDPLHTKTGAFISFFGVRRIVKDDTGDLAKKNVKSHMATHFGTPLETQALVNCPKNDNIITGSELSNL